MKPIPKPTWNNIENSPEHHYYLSDSAEMSSIDQFFKKKNQNQSGQIFEGFSVRKNEDFDFSLELNSELNSENNSQRKF